MIWYTFIWYNAVEHNTIQNNIVYIYIYTYMRVRFFDSILLLLWWWLLLYIVLFCTIVYCSWFACKKNRVHNSFCREGIPQLNVFCFTREQHLFLLVSFWYDCFWHVQKTGLWRDKNQQIFDHQLSCVAMFCRAWLRARALGCFVVRLPLPWGWWSMTVIHVPPGPGLLFHHLSPCFTTIQKCWFAMEQRIFQIFQVVVVKARNSYPMVFPNESKWRREKAIAVALGYLVILGRWFRNRSWHGTW